MSIENLIKGVRNVYKTRDFIPLHEPRFGLKEEELVLDCIKSTYVSSIGAYVDRVEDQLASLTKTAGATAMVNGTAAIQVSLRLVGVGSGDEVISQALTFVATANAIAYLGAHPVFIDVDLKSMGLSPSSLEAWLENEAEIRNEVCYNKKTGKRIAACVSMHTFGFMCDMPELVRVCKTWNIPLIEDAAEALGSSLDGKAAGAWGEMGTLSFNGNKIVTAGGGGAIVSQDVNYTNRAKHLTTTAKVPHPFNYVHDELGYNYRMPNLNASLLSAQLEKLPIFIEEKKKVFNFYKSEFGDSFNLLEPPIDQDWNYWLISVLAEDKNLRDEILKKTNKSGIMTRPIWQLMYRLPMYSNCQRDNQKNAEFLEERIVNIPSSALKGAFK